jgi:hypothetical protein
MLNFFPLLHITNCSLTTTLSSSPPKVFTLLPAYLQHVDERALPGNLQKSKRF